MSASRPTVDELGDGAADAIGAHFDDFFRRVAGDDGVTPIPGFFRLITGAPHPLGNLALIDAGVGADAIGEHTGPLCDGGFPSAALLLGGASERQSGALLARGFGFVEPMPLMSVTPEDLTPTGLPAGYEMVEAHAGSASADDWCGAMCAGYGLPPELGGLFGPDRCAAHLGAGATRHFGITHGGAMVATSMLFLHAGLAGVYGVATRAEHRGRGLGAHATAAALRHAWKDGYRAGILQASAMGAPVYRRLGFREHAAMALYARMPG